MYAQDNLNLRIRRMLEGSFPLDDVDMLWERGLHITREKVPSIKRKMPIQIYPAQAQSITRAALQ